MLQLLHVDHEAMNKNPPNFEIVGASAESTSLIPTERQGTYADIGATLHHSHSRSSFIPESSTLCDKHAIVLAEKTSFATKWPGQLILPYGNANLRSRNISSTLNWRYSLVSAGGHVDNGIESYSRRTDVGPFVHNGTTPTRAGYHSLKSGK